MFCNQQCNAVIRHNLLETLILPYMEVLSFKIMLQKMHKNEALVVDEAKKQVIKTK